VNELKNTVVVIEKTQHDKNEFIMHTIFRRLPADIQKQLTEIDGVKSIISYLDYEHIIRIARCFNQEKVIDQIQKCVLKYNIERKSNHE